VSSTSDATHLLERSVSGRSGTAGCLQWAISCERAKWWPATLIRLPCCGSSRHARDAGVRRRAGQRVRRLLRLRLLPRALRDRCESVARAHGEGDGALHPALPRERDARPPRREGHPKGCRRWLLRRAPTCPRDSQEQRFPQNLSFSLACGMRRAHRTCGTGELASAAQLVTSIPTLPHLHRGTSHTAPGTSGLVRIMMSVEGLIVALGLRLALAGQAARTSRQS